MLDSVNEIAIPSQAVEKIQDNQNSILSTGATFNQINPNQINSITEKCLEQTYNKSDIIIFSVINYEFRYQRPQHFAARFAENGHRVFYINANFVSKDSIKSVSNNLYAVDSIMKIVMLFIMHRIVSILTNGLEKNGQFG